MPEHWPGAFWKTPYTQWWDGYGTHDTVILDDFRGDCMRLTDLQRLLDWYPLWVEIKGGSLPMLATRYVITSNQHPADWYTRGDPPWDDPQARQGLRRGPWEAPGVPLGAGDRDREPSSLRWMAPYRLSKLDWIGLLGFCGSSGVILYPELPPVRSPLGPSGSPSQCRCVSGSHASRVPATAFVSVGYAGRLPAWCPQAPLAA